VNNISTVMLPSDGLDTYETIESANPLMKALSPGVDNDNLQMCALTNDVVTPPRPAPVRI